MTNLDKKVVLEFLGGIEVFRTAYSIAEIQKINCRYICTCGMWNVYENNETGEYLIAK